MRPGSRRPRNVLRAMPLVAAVLGGALWSAPAAAQNYRDHQRSEQNSRRLEENTKWRIEQIRAETQQALAAQRAADSRRSADEWLQRANTDYGGGSDDAYGSSGNATRRLSRSAPPPAGAEWIARARQAWQAGRDAEAAAHLRRASDAGSAGATRLLGSMYGEGIGVPKDAGTAVALYRKAAGLGDDEALLHLGRAYAIGEGAPENLGQALEWYTKASRRSTTRDQGERGVAAVRQLVQLDAQLAAAERCEKTGVCEAARDAPVAPPAAAAVPADRATAPTWSKLPVPGSTADFYVDRGSLSWRDDLVIVSELMDYRSPQPLAPNSSYLSARLRKEYDCRNGTMRILSAEAYASRMGSGALVMSSQQPTAPQAPRPGSPAEVLHQRACERP